MPNYACDWKPNFGPRKCFCVCLQRRWRSPLCKNISKDKYSNIKLPSLAPLPSLDTARQLNRESRPRWLGCCPVNEAKSLFKGFVWKWGTQKNDGSFCLCCWHGQALVTSWRFQNTVEMYIYIYFLNISGWSTNVFFPGFTPAASWVYLGIMWSWVWFFAWIEKNHSFTAWNWCPQMLYFSSGSSD